MARRGGKGVKERRGKGKEPAAGHQDEAASPRQGALAEWVRAIPVAIVLFLFIRIFLFQTFVITSGSMERTLLVGDFLVVNRAAIGPKIPFTGIQLPGYSEPRRGDVLVFDPPHTDELTLVKRLVGMPGDTLEMRDKALYINGARQDEPYVRYEDSDDAPLSGYGNGAWHYDYLAPGVDPNRYRPTRDNWGPLVMPEGEYFMLGDNRDASLDSRYWGTVERWRFDGRASIIYYSYDRDSFKPFAFIREIRLGRIGDRIR